MDRFNKPGSRQFEILGALGPGMPSEVVATVTADSIRFEPGFITFWVGHDNEVKTLTATARHDPAITGVKEVPLSEENLQKVLEYEASLISGFNKSHYDYFINPVTGESFRQYKAREERPIPPLNEQKPCWNKSTTHGVHLWGDDDAYCPGLIA